MELCPSLVGTAARRAASLPSASSAEASYLNIRHFKNPPDVGIALFIQLETATAVYFPVYSFKQSGSRL